MKKTQTYLIEVITEEDGTITMNRSNEGFNAFELLGILERTQSDIIDQMKGIIKPDFVKRMVVDDNIFNIGGFQYKTDKRATKEGDWIIIKGEHRPDIYKASISDIDRIDHVVIWSDDPVVANDISIKK